MAKSKTTQKLTKSNHKKVKKVIKKKVAKKVVKKKVKVAVQTTPLKPKKKEKIIRPKNKRNPYLCFGDVTRPTLSKDFDFTQITRELGKRWKELSKQEREPFVQLSVDDEKRYIADVAAFKEKYPNEPLKLEKKKKKEKIVKPKNPRSAYVIYSTEIRLEIKNDDDAETMDFGQVTTFAAKKMGGIGKKTQAQIL